MDECILLLTYVAIYHSLGMLKLPFCIDSFPNYTMHRVVHELPQQLIYEFLFCSGDFFFQFS